MDALIVINVAAEIMKSGGRHGRFLFIEIFFSRAVRGWTWEVFRDVVETIKHFP